MSKLFDALQYAAAERGQRPLPGAERVPPVAPACQCSRHAVRVRRQGVSDFLWRLAGLYPWQCRECGRRYRRTVRG